MSTIFIQIASYRDPQLISTLDDCISNAKHPENLRFCVCWQHDLNENIDKYKNDPRFKIIDIDYTKSEGACWARHKIQQHYSNETYTLQLDSHHRFIKNWDVELIEMFHELQLKGYELPIITAYLPSYYPETSESTKQDWGFEPWVINIDRFLPQGPPFLRPSSSNEIKNDEPCRARFLSGHFIFTKGSFVIDVPYDPDLYFHGEETSLAVRAFTHGYDLFHPHKVIAWHYYNRGDNPKHWGDHENTWSLRDKASYAKFRSLFGMNSKGQPESTSKYGFGNKRTLAEYERFAGIKFATRQIHIETVKEHLPPIKGDYEKGLTSRIKTCVSILKNVFQSNQCDVCVVAMLDEFGNDLFRKDFTEEEIRALLTCDSKDKFIHFWVDYNDLKQPYKSRVWPHEKTKGWIDRIEQVISYE